MLKRVVSVCAFAVLAGVLSDTAYAQPADARTYFTFNQPVTLPGVTLPAGTYLFRIPDATGNRQIVQVLSEDGTRLYTTLMAIRAQRPDASERPEVRFMETAAETPAAIKTWWYPGNPVGWEFIYPRQQAMRLAGMGPVPVLTTAAAEVDSAAEDLKTDDLARVEGSGRETAVVAEAAPATAAPTGEAREGTVASADLTLPANPTQVDLAAAPAPTAPARTALPQTAGSGPIAFVAGLLALAAGLGLATWPRARA